MAGTWVDYFRWDEGRKGKHHTQTPGGDKHTTRPLDTIKKPPGGTKVETQVHRNSLCVYLSQ